MGWRSRSYQARLTPRRTREDIPKHVDFGILFVVGQGGLGRSQGWVEQRSQRVKKIFRNLAASEYFLLWVRGQARWGEEVALAEPGGRHREPEKIFRSTLASEHLFWNERRGPRTVGEVLLMEPTLGNRRDTARGCKKPLRKFGKPQES